MPAVFSEKVKNKLGVEVAEELYTTMLSLIAERGVPKDELGAKLGAIEIRLTGLEKNYESMEKNYANVTGQIEGINLRIDKIHELMQNMEARWNERMQNMEARWNERMDGILKLMISQTKWLIGTILFVGTLITLLMSIFKFFVQ